jgi:hypothetical protein
MRKGEVMLEPRVSESQILRVGGFLAMFFGLFLFFAAALHQQAVGGHADAVQGVRRLGLLPEHLGHHPERFMAWPFA